MAEAPADAARNVFLTLGTDGASYATKEQYAEMQVEMLKVPEYNTAALKAGGGAKPGDLAYGHFEAQTMTQILDYLNCGPSDHVFDMGSGIGTVCMQAAAQYGCIGTGIEIRSDLSVISKAIGKVYLEEVTKRGLKSGPVSLWEGNGLTTDSRVLQALQTATIVIMNNKVWTPELQLAMHAHLNKHLQTGTYIVETLAAQMPKVGGPSAIATSEVSRFLFPAAKFESPKGAASWADKQFKYWIFTVGRPIKR